MKSEAVKEVLNTLFSHLEKLETQTEGLTQFLKEKKKVTDAQLAPYLEQAGKASNVRWRAARVRIEYLIDGAEREEEKARESEREKKPEIAAQEGQAAEAANPGPWGQGVGVDEKKTEGREQEDTKKGAESSDSGDSREGAGKSATSKRDDRGRLNPEPEPQARAEQDREPLAEAGKPQKDSEQKNDSDKEAA
jgi:hypothetical protein